MSETTAHFVYFVGSHSLEWTKIGYTKNPTKYGRIHGLQSGNPFDLFYALILRYSDERSARAAEVEFRDRFRKHHIVRREWVFVPWYEATHEYSRWVEPKKPRKKSAPWWKQFGFESKGAYFAAYPQDSESRCERIRGYLSAAGL